MWGWIGNHSTAEKAATSVIDQGCELEGRLTFVGTLLLNAGFKGEIFSSGTLLVGETGDVQAEVHVDIVVVNGQVTGNIFAQERVELRGKARVSGEIVTPILVLEEGVVFDGHCKMKAEEIQPVKRISS